VTVVTASRGAVEKLGLGEMLTPAIPTDGQVPCADVTNDQSTKRGVIRCFIFGWFLMVIKIKIQKKAPPY
jgi:hypothetical protein